LKIKYSVICIDHCLLVSLSLDKIGLNPYCRYCSILLIWSLLYLFFGTVLYILYFPCQSTLYWRWFHCYHRFFLRFWNHQIHQFRSPLLAHTQLTNALFLMQLTKTLDPEIQTTFRVLYQYFSCFPDWNLDLILWLQFTLSLLILIIEDWKCHSWEVLHRFWVMLIDQTNSNCRSKDYWGQCSFVNLIVLILCLESIPLLFLLTLHSY
jgi:hypothetical protein